jgi:hypothetical protein
MAGKGGAHRDISSFGVADFADENHIGILAQNRTQN